MATLIRDSFDPYSAAAQMAGVWSTVDTADIVPGATSRFGVGQGIRLATSGLTGDVQLSYAFGKNSSTVFINFAHMRVAAISGSTSQHKFRLYDGATVQCTLHLDNAGSMRFFRGDAATLLGTYSGAYGGSGTWNHFQVKIVINNATGSIEIRKDGSPINDFEVLGIDTASTANNFATSIDLACGSTNPDTHHLDDVWIFDSDVVAGEPSDWIGDCRAYQVPPNSDSAIALSRSAGATNFSNVDELIQSSTDYVFGATAGLTDEYGNGGLGSDPPDLILGLSCRIAVQKMDAGPRTVTSRIRSNGVAADATARTISTTLLQYSFRHDLNPDTGAAWTAAEIAAMTGGPRIVT